MTTPRFRTGIIQRLHDSEINCQVSTFFDGNFDWQIGDAMNGFVAEGSAQTFTEAERQLAAKACYLYPTSVFAQTYLDEMVH